MRLLPFMDIPVIDEKPPSAIDRMMDLVAWSDEDKAKLSAAFLVYENDGEKIDDYLFQIGYIKNNCLVTSKTVIEEAGQHCKEYTKWKEYMKVLMEIRCHLELYYEKINSIPPWGTAKYVKLKNEGMTPRVLEGPHKGGELKPNQKRKVILTREGNMEFGPLL